MSWLPPMASRRQPKQLAAATPLRVNQKCFIRKEHDCGKMFGASKSCFIACPSDGELEPTLALISEKLLRHGIEPIIAVKERAYGQDIFCAKICGKIIESKFCITILDDSDKNGIATPNPNVYYEYGLMTALGKHIVPLQEDGQQLAFNIQSYDTIKYTPKSLGAELERAIREAIRLSQECDGSPETIAPSERTILRRMEGAGWISKDYSWALNEVVSDTKFRAFEHEADDACLYLGKIDSDGDVVSYLEDLDVIVPRTEKAVARLTTRSASYTQQIEEAEAELQGEKLRRHLLPYKIEQMKEQLPAIDRVVRKTTLVYVGFIVSPGVVADALAARAAAATADSERFRITISSDGAIAFGDARVALA